MKILFITHRFYPDIGGIEVNSEILATAFTEAGHDLRLLTWSTDTTGKIFPYKIIRNPNKLRLLQEHAWADVIFENNPCLRLSWPRLLINRPSVVAIRALICRSSGKLGFQDQLKFVWLNQASGVIAVSHAIRKACWPPATVIGNPYRVNDFRILPNVSRTNAFVFLGRLVSQKGADMAILAIHHLLNSSDEKRIFLTKPVLTIVGEGPERDKLEQMVREFNLTEFVHFVGSLRGDALVTCLNRHRFLLVPSILEEAFGNVALEGMACGCLPIVSDCGGLPDAVGNAGVVFKSGDLDSLVSSIKNVLGNTKLEQQYLEAAPSHLTSHHPDVVSHRYLEVINRVFGK